MSDDQGPEYFFSAEEVQWLASDCLEKNRRTEGRIAQVTDDRKQNILYLLNQPCGHRIEGAGFGWHT